MKYLLVVLLILVVFWLWQSGRKSLLKAPRPAAKPADDPQITEVVACGVCHVHLPRSEALIGQGGFYCSEAHRREAGA